jgi:hypothetical protein
MKSYRVIAAYRVAFFYFKIIERSDKKVSSNFIWFATTTEQTCKKVFQRNLQNLILNKK